MKFIPWQYPISGYIYAMESKVLSNESSTSLTAFSPDSHLELTKFEQGTGKLYFLKSNVLPTSLTITKQKTKCHFLICA